MIQPPVIASDLNPIIAFFTGMEGWWEPSLTDDPSQHGSRDEDDRPKPTSQEHGHHKEWIVVRKDRIDSDDQGQQQIEPSSAGDPESSQPILFWRLLF
ncbi:MAG TPA: hypothetical protein P5186_07300 [Candidatus Paceibacterota bacterium]|nr:hypothetical protein [Verrucomicrobiota bacterium]HRY47835.1 hypothetical protein [Candidatus Paceibacterota bacterium]